MGVRRVIPIRQCITITSTHCLPLLLLLLFLTPTPYTMLFITLFALAIVHHSHPKAHHHPPANFGPSLFSCFYFNFCFPPFTTRSLLSCAIQHMRYCTALLPAPSKQWIDPLPYQYKTPHHHDHDPCAIMMSQGSLLVVVVAVVGLKQ